MKSAVPLDHSLTPGRASRLDPGTRGWATNLLSPGAVKDRPGNGSSYPCRKRHGTPATRRPPTPAPSDDVWPVLLHTFFGRSDGVAHPSWIRASRCPSLLALPACPAKSPVDAATLQR